MSQSTPNPSIERTSPGKPGAASHLKRSTSRKRAVSRWLLVLIFLATNAKAEPQPVEPKQPFFQMNAKAKLSLVEQAKTLKSGDSYQTVISRLGVPTYDQIAMRKENNHIIGRNLKYYAVKWDANLVNEIQDELVYVFLDEKHHVQSVQIKVKVEK